MGTEINGKFYSGNHADVLADFIRWRAKQKEDIHNMELVEQAMLYLDERKKIWRASDPATTVAAPAPPIQIRDEIERG